MSVSTWFKQSPLFRAEPGERAIADGQVAAQPAEHPMVLAEFFELANRADAFKGGVEPDGQQQARVEGGCPARPGLASISSSSGSMSRPSTKSPTVRAGARRQWQKEIAGLLPVSSVEVSAGTRSVGNQLQNVPDSPLGPRRCLGFRSRLSRIIARTCRSPASEPGGGEVCTSTAVPSRRVHEEAASGTRRGPDSH